MIVQEIQSLDYPRIQTAVRVLCNLARDVNAIFEP